MWFYLRIGVGFNNSEDERKVLESILIELKNQKMWSDNFEFKGHSITTIDNIYSLLLDHPILELNSTTPKLRMEIQNFGNNELRIFYSFSTSFILDFGSNFISAVANLFISLAKKAPKIFHFMDWVGLESRGVEFPKLFPPVQLSLFFPSYPIVVFNPENIRCNFISSEEAYNRLLDAKLPTTLPHAKRFATDNVLVFVWYWDNTDLEKCYYTNEQVQLWLKDLFNPPVQFGYNELGDCYEAHEFIVKSEEVLFYQTSQFKVIQPLLLHNGKLDSSGKVIELQKIKFEKKLNNGSPVKKVAIIVPSREDAITVKDQLDELGFDEVFYPDDEGKWWNPFPKGNWIKNR